MVLAQALAFLLALGADRRLTLFEQTAYGAKMQFAANSARSMVETREGYLYIATERGVRRFDGQRFVQLGHRDVLRSDSVRALAEGADGALWIGTDAGLTRLYHGRWERAGD